VGATGNRRVRLILNPRSGRRPSPERLSEAINWLQHRGWAVDRRPTATPDDARHLAAQAAAEGFDAVLVCGGDGTINGAVNGLAGSDTALAVIPAGTVNIWAREAGISRRPLEAVRLLEDGVRRRVDLGVANGRRFLMLASAGTDAYAVRAVSPAAKRRLGRYAYLVAGLRDLVTQGGRQMTVEAGGGRFAGRALVAIVGNTRLYGGALKATHRARLADGLLDLCLYAGNGWASLATHAARTLFGRHEGSAGVLYRQAHRITISGPMPMPYQVDGEYAGETPVTFEVLPASLTVVLPRSALGSPLFSASPGDGYA
jgi:YegS/Rv2252/BmrU family lipid kinase